MITEIILVICTMVVCNLLLGYAGRSEAK